MSLLCRSSKLSGAGGEEAVEIPQLQPVEAWDTVVDMPVGVQHQMPRGSECRKL